jgi:hypothetical protein
MKQECKSLFLDRQKFIILVLKKCDKGIKVGKLERLTNLLKRNIANFFRQPSHMQNMDAATAKSLLDIFARMEMDLSNKVDSFERFGMINPSEVFAKSVSEGI